MTNNNKERQINNRNYSKGSFLCVLLFDEQLEGKKKHFIILWRTAIKNYFGKKSNFTRIILKGPIKSGLLFYGFVIYDD